jgi:hypothetical protein
MVLRLLIVSVFALLGCSSGGVDHDTEMDIRKSFRNFVLSIKTPKADELNMTVYLPDVDDYERYVKDLTIDYLDKIQKGELVQDPQGLMLTRFLGLEHNRFMIKDLSLNEDGTEATMRGSIAFAYDNNITASGLEDGTKVFIPGQPWGTVHIIEIGSDENPAPREQVKSLEFVVIFRRTNLEGHWQVRSLEVDEATVQFETSFKNAF